MFFSFSHRIVVQYGVFLHFYFTAHRKHYCKRAKKNKAGTTIEQSNSNIIDKLCVLVECVIWMNTTQFPSISICPAEVTLKPDPALASL